MVRWSFCGRFGFPAVGHFEYLEPEWEVRDFANGYRYLDLAYMPRGAKGGIEVQGYGPHARDLDVRRFKDLCRRHSLMALDGWVLLPVAYLSIVEEPKQCQQLVLAFIGRFLATEVSSSLTWLEAEVVRLARRKPMPLSPLELAEHLRISDRHARRILHRLVGLQVMMVASGNKRFRTYTLRT